MSEKDSKLDTIALARVIRKNYPEATPEQTDAYLRAVQAVEDAKPGARAALSRMATQAFTAIRRTAKEDGNV